MDVRFVTHDEVVDTPRVAIGFVPSVGDHVYLGEHEYDREKYPTEWFVVVGRVCFPFERGGVTTCIVKPASPPKIG